MEFFEAVLHRRSVRKYNETPVPQAVIDKAIDAALLAPNSSNMQTWRIIQITSDAKRNQLIHASFNQGAARTSKVLLAFVADPAQWKVSRKLILENLGTNPRKDLLDYYQKLMPLVYGYRWAAPLKLIAFNLIGLFKPMMRKPWSSRDIEEVCIKSTALACENFMLAVAAQGFDTCPMEGFDETRVKRILGLSCRSRVVMLISVGMRDDRGIWGERFRIPRQLVVSEI